MNSSKLTHQTIQLLIYFVFLTACRNIQKEPVDSHLLPTSQLNTPNLSRPRDYWPTEDWRVASPEEQGINSEILLNMELAVEEQLPQIRSILIVRHGYLVYEKYYQGYDRNSYTEIQSAGKSIVSALTGIALQSSYLDSIDQKIIDFFPEYVTPDLDSQVMDITLQHLLTMTSGYPYCATADGCSAGPGEDPIKFALEQPITGPPGQKFEYTNHTVNYLLIDILARASNMDILEFADSSLCEPLGMSSSCERLKNDVTFKPRDMAKFGYLYLNQGFWEEIQLISTEWINTSTQRQNAGGSPHGEEYGYLFWVTTVQGYSAYFAGGYGGQFIYVVPDLDIVVVITSNFDRHYEENRNIVGDFIIPSVIE